MLFLSDIKNNEMIKALFSVYVMNVYYSNAHYMNQYQNSISDCNYKYAKAQGQTISFDGTELKLPTKIDVYCI